MPPRLTGVGVGDLVGLVRIQPNLLLAAAQDAGGQPLLEPEHAVEHTPVPLTHWTRTQTNTTHVHVYVCIDLSANCFLLVCFRALLSIMFISLS